MWCGKCEKQLAECTCPDINERLAGVAAKGFFTYKRCVRCGKHYERCKCDQPEWEIAGQPKLGRPDHKIKQEVHMGLGDEVATKVRAPEDRADLRSELVKEFETRVEVGRKIRDMAEEVSQRLFGQEPGTDKIKPGLPLGPGEPLGHIILAGLNDIRCGQNDTADALKKILNKL